MDDTGVFKLRNGEWGYRYSLLIDGQRITGRRTVDENGQKLLKKTDAIKARAKAIENAKAVHSAGYIPPVRRKTYREVYEEYCADGRSDRAFQTKRKQDSIWENHLKKKFGKRFVDDVSVGEINSYLAHLYYNEGYSYMYTESFLKMFYLILGQAYSRNYLHVDFYQKLCLNKNTKIHMPKVKVDDGLDIVVYSKGELAIMDDYFAGRSMETAYLLGKCCGLRINECFGLKWDHVFFDYGFIRIDRQMQYQNSIIKLVPVKTRNGKRDVYLSDKMMAWLQAHYEAREEWKANNPELELQNRRAIMDIDGSVLYSTELVNCMPDGKLQTVNTMKKPSRELKKQGVDFKYHNLRHTYASLLADYNIPQHILCKQMGHGNINVTAKYYLSASEAGVDNLRETLNRL